jgi:excisionase family DNA binding protein
MLNKIKNFINYGRVGEARIKSIEKNWKDLPMEKKMDKQERKNWEAFRQGYQRAKKDNPSNQTGSLDNARKVIISEDRYTEEHNSRAKAMEEHYWESTIRIHSEKLKSLDEAIKQLTPLPTQPTEQPRTDGTLEGVLLSIKDVQRILKCSRSTVYSLFDDGKLRSVKIGKSRRVWSEDVKAYINALQEESDARLAVVQGLP